MTALELWDLWVGDRILWELMLEPEFPEVLRRVIAQLRRGEGATRLEGPVPAALAGFEALLVSGRRAEEPAIRAALSALDFPVRYTSAPHFPGQTEALRRLQREGFAHPWVCDLGQTSVKLGAASHRLRRARDLAWLPVRTGDPHESIPEQRQRLRAWLDESLRAFARTTAGPDAVIFALPSRLDDASIPEGSSYIGMGGDGTLIADVMASAGLAPRVILAMNDAELAALEAIDDTGTRPAKTLVLTLGFGVGAALAMRA